MRADVNVIDLDKLRIHRPEVLRDLPSGAARWIQKASGYDITMCAGEVTVKDGQLTVSSRIRHARPCTRHHRHHYHHHHQSIWLAGWLAGPCSWLAALTMPGGNGLLDPNRARLQAS
jgi:hypothetical protein|eukprot:COSAG06_NODE_2344_length_7035_cov_13.462659_9_plen_117_part_00